MSAISFNFIIFIVEIEEKLSKKKRIWINIILVIATLLAFTIWLALTPPGIDGKMHAAGYSVCHQIVSHSISIGGKILPLCARCTGTFMGLLITILYLVRKGNHGGFPSKPKTFILILFFTAFAVDGINSTLSLLPGLSPLYTPNNLLRLATGLLFGISMGNLIIPLWNQTLWHSSNPEPALKDWRELLELFVFAAFTWLVILGNNALLYYPVALLSTGTIFLALGMVYSLLWCIIFKRENSLNRFRDGIRMYIAGILTAILQVGLMDALRYILTGTWNSFRL